MLNERDLNIIRSANEWVDEVDELEELNELEIERIQSLITSLEIMLSLHNNNGAEDPQTQFILDIAFEKYHKLKQRINS